MLKCEKCGALLDESSSVCPLCLSDLPGEEKLTVRTYANFEDRSKETSFLYKTMIFVSIITILVSFYINYFTFEYASSYWSLIVFMSLLFLRLAIRIIKSKKVYLGSKIMHLYCYSIVLLMTIDYSTLQLGWSFDFMLPILTMTIALIYGVFVSVGHVKFNEYFGFLLASGFLSILPILSFVLGFSSIMWLSMLSTLIIVIIVIGMYIYGKSHFKRELKKKLNM